MTQNTLARRARCVKEAQDELGQIRISGSISEVTPAYARVASLSRFLKLGECVSFSAGGLTQLAEVVRIDELGATVKTFDTMALARLGERVYCADALRIFPDQSWKGRVINALGVPIDALGPLHPGRKAARLDAPPPPAMRRARFPSRDRGRSGARRKVRTFAPRACRGAAPNIRRRDDRE